MMHRCPRCDGSGTTPRPDFPRSALPLGCALCNDTGTIDDATLERVRAGHAIRAERLASGFTLRKFAAQCGISPVDLSLIEQGLRPVPGAVRKSIQRETDV